MDNRAFHKSELAQMAGVSYSSFFRFLCTRRKELTAMGSPVRAQIVRGKVLNYICKEYNIQLPDAEQEIKKHEKFR